MRCHSDEAHRTAIAAQAAGVIGQNTTWIDLAHHLDASTYTTADPYETSGSTPRPFAPMFLAVLWAKVEEESLNGIPDRLADRPELAAAFGFEPEDLPDNSTFNRAWNTRFADLQRTLQRSATQIRRLAAEHGAPIGTQVTQHEPSAEADEAPSKRTITRLLRRKARDVLSELDHVVFPALSLPRPDEPIYDENELLTLATLLALKNRAANGGGEDFGDLCNPEPDLEEPFYEDGPSGETLLDALKQLSADEVADMVNRAAQRTFTRAKPKLDALDEVSAVPMVAIDITYVAYYGDREAMEWVHGAPEDKSYDWCHKYATISIVGDNVHFVLGMLPVGPGESEHRNPEQYPGEDLMYRSGEVVRELLAIADRYVNVRMVYADREFYAADVIAACEQYDTNYVIPARRDDRIKRAVQRAGEQVVVHDDYGVYGPVKDGPTNQQVATSLVILPPDDSHDAPQPFITNTEVDDEIGLDRRRTKRKIQRYRRRGGIETSYSKIKECAGWTTSKAFEVRLFHVGMAVCVYNMWLLVDFLTQARLGVIETRTTPRIDLARFLGFLDRQVVTLL